MKKKSWILVIAGILVVGIGVKYVLTPPAITFAYLVGQIERVRADKYDDDGRTIGELEYSLMVTDMTRSNINFPDIPSEQRRSCLYFYGGADLEDHGWPNAEYTMVGGKWRVDGFIHCVPLPAYQAPAEEVAWHYLRVRELRAQEVPTDDRIQIMAAESQNKPWETMI